MNKEQVHFKGVVIRKVYSSERFSVYGMGVDTKKYPQIKLNQYNNASICGELPALSDGIEYEVTATEEMGKHGISYHVINIRRDEPMTKQGVRSFLEEIISPNLAYTLSEEYPDIIERVKQNRLDDIDLSRMRGIGEKNFAKIVKKITENFYLSDLAAEFGGILTISTLRRIYDEYGSVELLKEKLIKAPYSTLTRVNGIGFKIADSKIIAMQKEGVVDFGFDIRTSVDRCLACITFLLEENEKNDGHTKMNLIFLAHQVEDMVPTCADKFAEAISDKSIYYNRDNVEVALQKTYNMEQSIAKTIFYNLHNNNIWRCDVEKYRSIGEFDLSDEQLSIVGNVCKNNISILNGPAGSGKTQSTKAIINMLEDMGKSYVLMSSTGKAAKVLSELTGRYASTIHRGLGYNGVTWELHREHKLNVDIVIVDEMSMVDVWLFWHLLDAINLKKTKLLMIGDNAQLPSVGCGNLLHDFMATNLIPTVTLTKIFRYGEGGLMKVATDIRMGKNYMDNSMKNKITSFGNNKDYTFIDMPSEKIPINAVAMYKKMLENENTVNDIQVITPKKKGNYGTTVLNKMLQKVANPNYGSAQSLKHGDSVYYVGDLIVECTNNYDAPLSPDYIPKYELPTDGEKWPTAFVANGETGIIKGIGLNTIDIDFDGIIVRYDRDMINFIKLGYAITCHKSQGSSINNVILLTPQSDIFMLNSNLLYVGCTRARNKCIHLGSVDTINKVIKRKANLTRHTFMQQMLKDLSSM